MYVAPPRGSAVCPSRQYTNALSALLWVKEVTVVEVKQCPVCWGKKVVCVGLKENLDPILEPCTGCDGTGWIAFKYVNKEKDNERAQV